MISQEQSEQMPSVEEKRWLMPEEEWQRTNLLLVILGIELPLIGGFWVWNNYPWSYVMFLSVFLGALLLRSWWAMLIVPVAFSVGFFLSSIFQMGGFDLQNWAASGFEGVDILVILGVVPVAIGIAIGTPIGKKIEQRLQQ